MRRDAKCLCPGHARKQGCWYSKGEWVRVAASVRRSGPCWVTNCANPVAAADHIEEVHAGTTWAQFISRSNLRPACRRHNTVRGMMARYQREVEGGVEAQPRAHPLQARGSFMRARAL